MSDERTDAELKATISLGDASPDEHPVETAFGRMAALQDRMTAAEAEMAYLRYEMQEYERQYEMYERILTFLPRLKALQGEMNLLQHEMMALQYEMRQPGVEGDSSSWMSPELLALGGAITIYSKAFLETLAKRHADALTDLLNKRFRRSGKNTEAEIGLDGDAAAKIVVIADMPDEARLALLDLDVTADEVRGKLLRWDDSTSAWRPADDK